MLLGNLKYFISETGKFSLSKSKIGDIIKVVFKNTYSKLPHVIIGVEEYPTNDIFYSQIKIINKTNTYFQVAVMIKNLDNYSPEFSYMIVNEI